MKTCPFAIPNSVSGIQDIQDHFRENSPVIQNEHKLLDISGRTDRERERERETGRERETDRGGWPTVPSVLLGLTSNLTAHSWVLLNDNVPMCACDISGPCYVCLIRIHCPPWFPPSLTVRPQSIQSKSADPDMRVCDWCAEPRQG